MSLNSPGGSTINGTRAEVCCVLLQCVICVIGYQIESVVVIPLVIMMILKSTEPQKYPFGQLKDLVIIGSPLKPSTEDLLLKTYPGLQLRQCIFTFVILIN